MWMKQYIVSITTDAAGDAVGYTAEAVRGRVLQLAYVKTDYANGVDFDVILETTGTVVWDQDNVNASATVVPRQGVHDTVGVAATLDGTRLMRDFVYVASERIKITVAQGGDTKSGTFYILVG
jgi:hypothetical protein